MPHFPRVDAVHSSKHLPSKPRHAAGLDGAPVVLSIIFGVIVVALMSDVHLCYDSESLLTGQIEPSQYRQS